MCTVGGGRPGRRLERGVVSQDRLLEPLQGLAGLDSELVDQVVPGLPVGVECVRLAVGAVEGEHLLGAQAFPQRMLANEHLQLAEHVLVTAQREIAIDPVHQQAVSRNSSSRATSSRPERLERKPGQCRDRARTRAPPPSSRQRCRRLAVGHALAGLRDEPLRTRSASRCSGSTSSR